MSNKSTEKPQANLVKSSEEKAAQLGAITATSEPKAADDANQKAGIELLTFVSFLEVINEDAPKAGETGERFSMIEPVLDSITKRAKDLNAKAKLLTDAARGWTAKGEEIIIDHSDTFLNWAFGLHSGKTADGSLAMVKLTNAEGARLELPAQAAIQSTAHQLLLSLARESNKLFLGENGKLAKGKKGASQTGKTIWDVPDKGYKPSYLEGGDDETIAKARINYVVVDNRGHLRKAIELIVKCAKHLTNGEPAQAGEICRVLTGELPAGDAGIIFRFPKAMIQYLVQGRVYGIASVRAKQLGSELKKRAEKGEKEAAQTDRENQKLDEIADINGKGGIEKLAKKEASKSAHVADSKATIDTTASRQTQTAIKRAFDQALSEYEARLEQHNAGTITDDELATAKAKADALEELVNAENEKAASATA